MSATWDDELYVAMDVEASGTLPEYALQPWRYKRGDYWLTSFAAVWREVGETRAFGGVYPDLLMIREFLTWVIQTKRIIVGWNIVYDIGALVALGFREEVYQIRWLDGMLVWRHVFIEPEYDENRANKKSYALKPGAVQEFVPDMAGYEENVNYHSTDPEELEKLHLYNIRDNIAALRITKKLYLKLKTSQRLSLWTETRCLPMIAEANVLGLPIDTLVSRELSAHLDKTAAKCLESLSPHGVTEDVIRSPKQLANLMFNIWKLPILKTSVTAKAKEKAAAAGVAPVENPSTDKEVLWELALVDPRAKELREYRNALNNKTKFADRLQQAVEYNDDDSRVHPLMGVFRTYTGRITVSSKQNVEVTVSRQTKKGITYRQTKVDRPIGWAQHQMKRDKEFRKQVIAPLGYDMVEFDAAGQEYKWMAVASNDPVMLQLSMPGEDPHSYMTAAIYHLDYRETQRLNQEEHRPTMDKRKLGKIGNLSCQYRTSAKRLRIVARVDYDVPMFQTEADLIWTTYQRTYRGVPSYWTNQIERVKALGYVETFAGRRVQVVGDWSGTFGWRMGSTAINYRIQGTGADQKYLAMSLLRDKLIEYDGYFAFDLHDGLYSFLPKAKSRAFIEDVKPLLDDLPYGPMWGFIPPVPMTWDTKVGPSWGQLKGWHP